ncbi:hypothetical protein F0562_001912 [Nyssa sinensis]|uniref:DUF7054 domain-containing protein n=1 Tax=Nyssa sinensis TaxID=561372 RepID=A0A5J5C4K9_9ASTE|nr:hypothetical protein F0562_001912 [Nyssa sinensis]
MPTSKNHRRGHEEQNRRGRLAEKASSFHGRSVGAMGDKLSRPRTVPDLLSGRNVAIISPEGRPKLTKLLLNVTIQRSLGAVQVVMSPESAVGDLIVAALRQYGKEGRRLILHSTNPSDFDLHYSQFSLESLDREEKLMTLGSRNFFLCPKKSATGSGGGEVTTPSASCAKQAEKVSKIGHPWLKFMDFLF